MHELKLDACSQAITNGPYSPRATLVEKHLNVLMTTGNQQRTTLVLPPERCVCSQSAIAGAEHHHLA